VSSAPAPRFTESASGRAEPKRRGVAAALDHRAERQGDHVENLLRRFAGELGLEVPRQQRGVGLKGEPVPAVQVLAHAGERDVIEDQPVAGPARLLLGGRRAADRGLLLCPREGTDRSGGERHAPRRAAGGILQAHAAGGDHHLDALGVAAHREAGAEVGDLGATGADAEGAGGIVANVEERFAFELEGTGLFTITRCDVQPAPRSQDDAAAIGELD